MPVLFWYLLFVSVMFNVLMMLVLWDEDRQSKKKKAEMSESIPTAADAEYLTKLNRDTSPSWNYVYRLINEAIHNGKYFVDVTFDNGVSAIPQHEFVDRLTGDPYNYEVIVFFDGGYQVKWKSYSDKSEQLKN